MLVAGGSGITYLLSVFSELIASSLTSSNTVQRVKVVYIVRDVSSSTHFLERLEELADLARSANFQYTDVEIFVTGSKLPNKWEVEEVYRSLSWQSGRPDLLYCLSAFLRSAGEGTRVGSGAVLAACGPRPLIDSVSALLNCLSRGSSAYDCNRRVKLSLVWIAG
jgi:ferredoxin-NADP reductase